MGSWTMHWGDRPDGDDVPLLHTAWQPQPVPTGATRFAVVAIRGFYHLPADPLLVAWDDQRATVRLATGELRWYTDGSHQAYPREGEIVVEDVHVHPFPRGNRYMDALVVRSLQDLIENVNAEEITSIDEDGTLHFLGEHDNSRGELMRSEDAGVILRASGVEGTRPWQLEVLTTRLIEEGDELLQPADVTPPQDLLP